MFTSLVHFRIDIFFRGLIKNSRSGESSKSINTQTMPKLDQSHAKEFSVHSSAFDSTTGLKCNFCGFSHTIYHCVSFFTLSISERIKRVKELKLCVNCHRSHAQKKCLSRNYFKYSKSHNTFLHLYVHCNSVERSHVTKIKINLLLRKKLSRIILHRFR